MSTKLSLQSVAKAFGTNQVLRDVSLDINTGEVVSFNFNLHAQAADRCLTQV